MTRPYRACIAVEAVSNMEKMDMFFEKTEKSSCRNGFYLTNWEKSINLTMCTIMETFQNACR